MATRHGGKDPGLADGRATDLMLARAQLNGGAGKLNFLKWNGGSYASPGIGGVETISILADGNFASCGDVSQTRAEGRSAMSTPSSNIFCSSSAIPRATPPSVTRAEERWAPRGSSGDDFPSRFRDPTQWSRPQEITGTWSLWDTTSGCDNYPGWYPTAMSLTGNPGHLSLTGYIFYLSGCKGAGSADGRTRRRGSTRRERSAITLTAAPLSISTSAQLAPATLGAAYLQTLAATGGVAPYTWTVIAGTLPAGLTLSQDGVISGTPTTAGSTTVMIQVVDSNGASATQAFTMVVAPASSSTLLLSSDGTSVYDSDEQH